jgi:hypothetical protein
MYLTRTELNGFKNKTELNIASLTTAAKTFTKRYPIALTDLGSDITSFWNTTNYYAKNSPIDTRSLVGIPTKAYVDSVTESGTEYAYNIIDECVLARQGKLTILSNLGNYAKKANLITDINALTGVIDKERCQVHDHNDTTLRNATGCHIIADITGLTSTLSDLAEDATIINSINLSAEGTKILPSQIQTLSHATNVSDQTENNCHPITAITGLVAELQKGIDAKNDITVTNGTYANLLALFQCIIQYIQAIDPTETYAPPEWITP